MSTQKKSVLTLALLFGLLAVSSLIDIVLPDDSVFSVSSVSTCYLLLLSVSFYLYINWTIADSSAKTYLLRCGVLFAVIFLLRGARYVAFVETDQIMRYLWYLYYLPLIIIPYCSFRAAVCVGNTDESFGPKWHRGLGAVSAILVLLICTNDLHQWAFRLNSGFREHWIDEYTHGPLYYIVYAWIALLQGSSLAILFRKCRVASCRRQIWVPIVPSVFGILWLTMIALGKVPSRNNHLLIEFPEAFCFTVAAAWVCCVRIGLVPANKSYAALFSVSSVHAMISDKSGNIIYRSKDVDSAEGNDNIRVQSQSIRGGQVSWQQDVTQINRLNRKLDGIRQQLEEETELIRLENDLKAKNTMLEAKSAVYDMIAVRVLPQSAKITALSSTIEPKVGQNTFNLKMICFYGCYIKRMSNLMLIASQQPSISEMEFALAVGESLNYIRSLGVQTAVYADETDRSYPASQIVSAYETFQQYVEQALPVLAGIQVTIRKNVCRLTLECSEARELLPMGMASIERDEETLFITIPFTERGLPV